MRALEKTGTVHVSLMPPLPMTSSSTITFPQCLYSSPLIRPHYTVQQHRRQAQTIQQHKRQAQTTLDQKQHKAIKLAGSQVSSLCILSYHFGNLLHLHNSYKEIMIWVINGRFIIKIQWSCCFTSKWFETATFFDT